LRLGRWDECLAEITQALGLHRASGQRNDALLLCLLARLEAGMGRQAECRRHADEALDLARRLGAAHPELWARAALGLAALGAGRAEEAAGQYGQVTLLAEPVAHA